jgi:excisionase family DNA binding protein
VTVEERTQTGSRRGPATGGAVETPSRLLSAQAAAKYLGVPYTSLRDWAFRGHIPIVRVPACRRLWFDRRDLDRAIEAWKERAAQ